jgi:[acyl-carrier-protein] S-malonyltransferase
VGKTAIIFPGQGAQHPGMGKDVAESSEAARAVYSRANEIVGWDLAGLCFSGPAEKLNGTDIQQPAIFVTSVAIWKAMESNGLAQDLAPQAMAGLSLGEYTALHLAGWIDFEDSLRLVAERGRLMQEAATQSSGGMVSLMGLNEEQSIALCKEASRGEPLAPANFNCPGQIVISGAKSACQRALELAERHGAKAVELDVAGAFHSDLMGPAVTDLEKALSIAKIGPGRIPVASNVSARYHDGPLGVRTLLREQVAKPVRWQASIEELIAHGFDRFVEVGPGRVLTGLMRRINRAATALNFSTAAALEKGLG